MGLWGYNQVGSLGGTGKVCFPQSTVRPDVTVVPSTEGVESSGSNSAAHRRLEWASRAWVTPSGARPRGSEQRRSQDQPAGGNSARIAGLELGPGS